MKLCGNPGKKSKKIIAEDRKFISPCVTRPYLFVYQKAKGCYIWDADGKKFLDFCSSVAVMNSGHTNPYVVKAVKKQLKEGLHCGFTDFFAEVPLRFAQKVISLLPKSLNQAFLSNSGTESVEAAYKLARWHTKKKWVIAFSPCFHGRTMGSLSMTNAKPVQRARFDPFLPVKHTPYPYCYRCAFGKTYGKCSFECLNALEKTIRSCKGNLAAIFIEPIAGEPGYIPPPFEFHKGLRKLCNDYNVLFCADEIQSGNFRTGTFLALENYKVVPDVVCLSKAVGGGLPIGVTVANRKLQDWPSGSHACFNRRAKVILADGSRKEISEIVNKKLKVKVLSYNSNTGKTEAKLVINWFKKRNVGGLDWYKVITTRSIKDQAPCVTKWHKYWVVNKGWVQVKDLKKGDRILLPVPQPSKIQEQVILGSLLGDGTLSDPRNVYSNARNPHLTLGHKEEHLEYLERKHELLRDLASHDISFVKETKRDCYNRQDFYYFRTKNLPCLLNLRKKFYVEGQKTNIPLEVINKLEPLGLAVWYMDDGRFDEKWGASLSIPMFDEESVDNIVTHFKKKYDITWRKIPKRLKGGREGFYLKTIKKEGSHKFFELVAPYVSDCMQYKLRKEFRGKSILKNLRNLRSQTNFVPTIGEVVKVVKAKNKKKDYTIYDIEVADNHNYFIPTALVSNSTFGGNLIACAAGIANLDFMKKKKLGENARKIGSYMLKRLLEMKEKYEIIGDVRGLGLMIGVEIVKNKKSKKYGIEERHKVVCTALKKGLILLSCGKSTVRIAPPLIITKKEADKGLNMFESSLREVMR